MHLAEARSVAPSEGKCTTNGRLDSYCTPPSINRWCRARRAHAAPRIRGPAAPVRKYSIARARTTSSRSYSGTAGSISSRIIRHAFRR